MIQFRVSVSTQHNGVDQLVTFTATSPQPDDNVKNPTGLHYTLTGGGSTYTDGQIVEFPS